MAPAPAVLRYARPSRAKAAATQDGGVSGTPSPRMAWNGDCPGCRGGLLLRRPGPRSEASCSRVRPSSGDPDPALTRRPGRRKRRANVRLQGGAAKSRSKADIPGSRKLLITISLLGALGLDPYRLHGGTLWDAIALFDTKEESMILTIFARICLKLVALSFVLVATTSWADSPFPSTDPVSTNTCNGKFLDSDASSSCTPWGNSLTGSPAGGAGKCYFSGYCYRDDGVAFVIQTWSGTPDETASLQNCDGTLSTSSC